MKIKLDMEAFGDVCQGREGAMDGMVIDRGSLCYVYVSARLVRAERVSEDCRADLERKREPVAIAEYASMHIWEERGVESEDDVIRDKARIIATGRGKKIQLCME